MPLVTLKSPVINLPNQLEVSSDYEQGGQGQIYFSLDEKYAVKIYTKPRDNQQNLLQHVMKLFESLPVEHQRFIVPPLALVDRLDGRPCVGFIMKKAPSIYRKLENFILTERIAFKQFQDGKTWGNYLKVARSIARAIRTLHFKGCAHSDIHPCNFLVNLDEGDSIMLEADGVVVPGFLPPQVEGRRGYQAPEILTKNVAPSERTDRHSLAVLILHTLLFRNVLQFLNDYDDDPDRSEDLGWGKFALFNEHPTDRSNRLKNLGLPFYRRGILSYKILTPSLQRLTEAALIEGLHTPDKRPSPKEWEEALACADDEILICVHCQQCFPFTSHDRICPFCGEHHRPPYPVVLELYEERSKYDFMKIGKYGRHLVLGQASKLFTDMITPQYNPPFKRQNESVVGHVELNSNKGEYRLFNNEGGQWIAYSPTGGQRLTATRGQSLPLIKGFSIVFGEGRRLAIVKE